MGIFVATAGMLFAGGAFAQEAPPPAKPMGTAQVKCVPSGKCDQARVHFAFDSAVLDDEAKAILDETAQCLKTNQNVQISIEGSTDKRGSAEYNKKLGMERADAVSCYLQSRGVPKAQLTTVSLGETRPLCPGATESCFAQNRNATLVPAAPVAVR
jgi:peptidoglycan-associated lipoprotein